MANFWLIPVVDPEVAGQDWFLADAVANQLH
jgi:hypothetical protein